MSIPREHDEQIPQDELDAMLRAWHEVNGQRAMKSRAVLMQRLAARPEHPAKIASDAEYSADSVAARHSHILKNVRMSHAARWSEFARAAMANRVLRAAASFALLITFIGLLVPMMHTPAVAAQREVMLPDGGRLEARDERGQLIGPCALTHTDVKINVTGPFTRVTVRQQFQNPYTSKIEAVYTFPLSNRAAVDSMSMTIGDRVVQAEMKERQQARQIYDSARSQGYVASLLEQERPNIFTQSVANIEPGVDITIEIRYIEMLQSRDGVYNLAFPIVVAPRYIPGSPLQSRVFLPAELQSRRGSILLGPASIERMKLDVTGQLGNGQASFNKQPLGPAPYLQRVIDAARPIHPPGPAFRAREDVQQLYRSNPSFDFDVIYAGGNREFGQIAGDGLGHINGRWFYFDPALLHELYANGQRAGAGYEADTTQVPDASRITPMPVRPPTRAGHDISVSIAIDTGGPAIIDYHSDLHEIICTDGPRYRNLGNKINLALRDQHEIPNRDFVLSWKTIDDRIQESTFAYIDPKSRDNEGGFFTVILAPPARVDNDAATPRELIFVLDTSGSMQGLPIEKAKAVMSKAIDAMRPRDTFNLITFSGDTRILWDLPRPNTPDNRHAAQNFLASQQGNGGTEMMAAINASLAPSNQVAPRALTPEELANLPADGREVLIRTPFDAIEAIVKKNAIMQPSLRVRKDLAVKLTPFQLPVEQVMRSPDVLIRGKWSTLNGERTLEIASATVAPENQAAPLRIVMFLTDGQVGNDDAIIQAVQANAKTTRVFGFGIGDSPNRNLLDGMAQAGRGEVEYVNLNSNPDEAVQRFVTRIGTPVLTDIHLSFSDTLKVSDTLPSLDAVPDLFDLKPLVIHGRFLPLPQGEGWGEAREKTDASKLKGQLTITGTTGSGPYSRTIDLDLSPKADDKDGHAVIATLWARAKIDELQKHPDAMTQQKVIALGEQFSIMTPYTSFVAVEKARLTIAGRSMLVPVPIELPEGMTWEGTFGGERNLSKQAMIDRVRKYGIDASLREVYNDQKESRFEDAIGVLDAILAVEPSNQAALALRDVIRATMVYRDYQDVKGGTKDYGMSAPGLSDPSGRFGWKAEVANSHYFHLNPSLNEMGSANGAIVNLQHANAEQLAVELNGLMAEPGSGTGLDRPATGLTGQGFGGLADNGAGPAASMQSESSRIAFPWQSERGGGEQSPAPGPVTYWVYSAFTDAGDYVTTAEGPALPEIENKLQAVEDQMRTLIRSAGLTTPDDSRYSPDHFKQQTYVTQRADSVVKLNMIVTEYNMVAAKLEGLQQPTAEDILEADRDPALQTQMTEVGRLQAEYRRAAADRLPDDPSLRQTHESLRAAEEQADSTRKAIITSNLERDAQSLSQSMERYKAAAERQEEDLDRNSVILKDKASATAEYNMLQIVRDQLEVARSAQMRNAANTGAPAGAVAAVTNGARAYGVVESQPDSTPVHVMAIPGQNALFVSGSPEYRKNLINVIQSFDKPSPEDQTVLQALAEKTVQIDFHDNSLDQIINFFRMVTGLSIKVDWPSLACINVKPETMITLQVADFKAGAALTRVLAEVGTPSDRPQYIVRDGCVLITTAAALQAKAVQMVPMPPDPEKQRQIDLAKRIANLRRIIDQRLWDLVDVLVEKHDAQDDSALTPALTPALSQGERGVNVILSVRDVRNSSLDELRNAGLNIADIAKSQKVIAGSIEADQLDDLAMLDCVRRIEPINEQTANR